MKIIISEKQLKSFINKLITEGYTFDPEVVKVQEKLKDEYNLGNYGPKSDGVDGLLGPLTKRAMKTKMTVYSCVKKEYQELIDKHSGESDVQYDTKQKEIEKSIKKDSSDYEIFSEIEPNESSDVIIFVSGLHHRGGDLSVSQQKNKIVDGLNKDKIVLGFAWENNDEAIKKLNEFPKASVVLFSKGCAYARKFAQNIKYKENLYIVEPHPSAKGSIEDALSMGVPVKNVILGGGSGSGKGLFKNATETPRQYSGHWPALTFIGSVIS